MSDCEFVPLTEHTGYILNTFRISTEYQNNQVLYACVKEGGGGHSFCSLDQHYHHHHQHHHNHHHHHHHHEKRENKGARSTSWLLSYFAGKEKY